MKARRVVMMTLTVVLACLTWSWPARAASNSLQAADGSPENAVWVDNDGKVGIGTTTPRYGLDVVTGAGWTTAKFGSGVTTSLPIYMVNVGNPTIGFNARCIDSWQYGEGSTDHYGAIIGLAPVEGTLFLAVSANKGAAEGDPRPFAAGLYVTKDSKVGIGTEYPDAKLTIQGRTPDADYLLSVGGSGNGKMRVRHIDGKADNSNDPDGLYLQYGVPKHTIINAWSIGNVGIGTENPQAKLDVLDRIRISDSSGNTVLELGKGLDYAEGFDVSGSTNAEAGSVLVIDPANPGKLRLSDSAYDKKVAGITAGAKGLGSAVRLGVGQFDCDVALAGRVYCNVDATSDAVEPGDLLTTSDVPGYAMRAADHTRATGAILGKAMEPLTKGMKGQILVLVTLQ